MTISRAISFLAVVAGALGLLTLLATFAVDYGKLPETIPTHFGATGVPNAWGPKSVIVALPIVGLVIFGISMLVTTLANASGSRPVPPRVVAVLRVLSAETIWLLEAVQSGTFRVAFGQAATLGSGFFILLTAVVATGVALTVVSISAAGRCE